MEKLKQISLHGSRVLRWTAMPCPLPQNLTLCWTITATTHTINLTLNCPGVAFRQFHSTVPPVRTIRDPSSRTRQHDARFCHILWASQSVNDDCLLMGTCFHVRYYWPRPPSVSFATKYDPSSVRSLEKLAKLDVRTSNWRMKPTYQQQPHDTRTPCNTRARGPQD